MEHYRVISGKALIGEDLSLQRVDIVIDKGFITAIEETQKAPDIWICPALFNAHTHLGDTIAMDCAITGDLVAHVTPPHGLKHQILEKTPRQYLVRGMMTSIAYMAHRGIGGCADFREGGIEGVAALREACGGFNFRCMIFGRDGGECSAHGLGISSTRDIPDVERCVARARQENKLIAFHAGEKDSDDIDTALSFNPDLIIHGTHATRSQLRECAERSIPIAVCPRSNWILGVTSTKLRPPVTLMRELGCRVYLGTDNAMFVQPDLLAEMAFVHTIYRLEPDDVIRMAVAGSALTKNPFFIRIGERANLFAIDPRFSNLRFSGNIAASIVKRGFSGIIGTNVFNA
jgi:cytosine/adenosine deaminase-related metal-dependent hydrolase